MSEKCLIALGGNEGDVPQAFRKALDSLGQHENISVVAVSSFISTPPIGRDAGGTFTNAAALLLSELDPFELLDVLQDLERIAGRVRKSDQGPRPLDLDLITCGNQVVRSKRLTLPHPKAWYRRFVLDPICEIRSTFIHPERLATWHQLRSRLSVEDILIRLHSESSEKVEGIKVVLRREFRDQVRILEGFGQEHLATFDIRLDKHIAIDLLPILSRLDLSDETEQVDAIIDVVNSALDC